jgi:hypothetical protein
MTTFDMASFANGLLARPVSPPRIAPPPAASHIPHYRYLCLDLETQNPPAAVLDRVIARKMADYEPPANYKDPEKIAAHKAEAMTKARDKSGLWNEAPIGAIVLKSDVEFRLLHTMRAEAPRLVEGATVQGFASEKEMLIALRGLLVTAVVMPDAPPTVQGVTPIPTEIVCHNGLSFDLPKLRTRMVVNRIQLPRCLTGEIPVFDTMRVFARRFGCDSNQFIAMDAICEMFGIPQHKQIVASAEIPGLIAAGEIDKVIAYTLLDGLDTEQIYLFMAGQHPGAQ